MAARLISSPLPAYPAGSARLTTRPPAWGLLHPWAGLDDPGPRRLVNDGTTVVVADGTTRGYSWVHGLGVLPLYVHVDHAQSLPLPAFLLGWDATRISVRFDTAPTRNLDLRWFVQGPGTDEVGVVILLPAEPLVTEAGDQLLAEDGSRLMTEGAVV